MRAYRKASIRELSSAAYELGGHVVQGVLRRDPETGKWLVGDKTVEAWLETYVDQEIVLTAISLEADAPLETKVCRTCGREYRGYECPHCRQARVRLRGY